MKKSAKINDIANFSSTMNSYKDWSTGDVDWAYKLLGWKKLTKKNQKKKHNLY